MNWDINEEKITPAIARSILAMNIGNRNVRTSVVSKYAKDMKNGMWLTTPEGIAIDKTGNLIDGQHRLHAIVESGVSQNMLVFRNVDPEVYSKLNRGLVRSYADALGIDKFTAQIARLFCVIYSPRFGTITDKHINRAANIFQPVTDKMPDLRVKFYSSAPARLACVLASLNNPEHAQYIIQCFTKMNKHEFHDLPPIFSSLIRASTNMKSGGGHQRQIETFMRFEAAFSPENRYNGKVQINEGRIKKIQKRYQHIWEKVSIGIV